MLTGIRLAIGIIWIVLVPAEMLGVTAGLGYFILDTRDRLAYDELMAGILERIQLRSATPAYAT
jgi:NitT/TauT family transport system permease protein